MGDPRRARTKSDVFQARITGAFACCDRYADHSACNCLELAVDDLRCEDRVASLDEDRVRGLIRQELHSWLDGAGKPPSPEERVRQIVRDEMTVVLGRMWGAR